MAKVEIEASKLLVVTENHGGYLGGQCLWCGAVGWMDRLAHKPECPVPAAMKPPELAESQKLRKTRPRKITKSALSAVERQVLRTIME